MTHDGRGGTEAAGDRLAYAVYLPSRKLLVYRWFNPNIPDGGPPDAREYSGVVVKRM